MRRKKTLTSLILIMLMIFSLSGCRVSPPDPVEISAEEEAKAMGFEAGNNVSVLHVGDYSFFDTEIKVEYEYALGWYSSNPEVATVDSNGRVDAISPGKVTIICTAKKASVDYEITVKDARETQKSFSTAIDGDTEAVDLNISGEKNKNPYAILINTRTGCMTAYTYNSNGIYSVAVRSMRCSVNEDYSTAEFTIEGKDDWTKTEGKWYQYVTFCSSEMKKIQITSCAYSERSADTLITKEYNTLGSGIDGTNILLSAADAEWVYNNCAEGTLVKITNSEKDDPLGVPVTLNLSDTSPSTKWDPTDSSENNPYYKLTPYFSGTEDAFIKVDSTFDAYSGVKVYDTCMNEVEGFAVDGSVVCSRPGKYVITYLYTDSMGRTGRVDRTVTVLKASEYDEYKKTLSEAESQE